MSARPQYLSMLQCCLILMENTSVLQWSSQLLINICFSGVSHVYISTFLFNGYSEEYFSQLKSAPETLMTHGVLCASGTDPLFAIGKNVTRLLLRKNKLYHATMSPYMLLKL